MSGIPWGAAGDWAFRSGLSVVVIVGSVLAFFRWSGKTFVDDFLKRKFAAEERDFRKLMADEERNFKARLAVEEREFKRAQDQEIEAIRHRFNALADRKIKLNNQEFEVLPRVWKTLVLAHSEVNQLASGRFVFGIDLSRSTAAELESYLKGFNFEEYVVQEILNSHDRQSVLNRHRTAKEFNSAWSDSADFVNLLADDALFIPEELKAILVQIRELQTAALIEYRFNLQGSPSTRTTESLDRYRLESQALVDQVEQLIIARLWKDSN